MCYFCMQRVRNNLTKETIIMAATQYDNNNVFAKILRGEIPCKKVYEDDYALAFHDINPQAPIHVLVIPKGPYVSMMDFTANAPAELVAGFLRAVGETARTLGLEESGYRVLANAGANAHQEVPHLHFHIFGGRPLGPMLVRRD
jgi:histidine triad (HIT) family protein